LRLLLTPWSHRPLSAMPSGLSSRLPRDAARDFGAGRAVIAIHLQRGASVRGDTTLALRERSAGLTDRGPRLPHSGQGSSITWASQRHHFVGGRLRLQFYFRDLSTTAPAISVVPKAATAVDRLGQGEQLQARPSGPRSWSLPGSPFGSSRSSTTARQAVGRADRGVIGAPAGHAWPKDRTAMVSIPACQQTRPV
jgi:hypothetical protein